LPLLCRRRPLLLGLEVPNVFPIGIIIVLGPTLLGFPPSKFAPFFPSFSSVGQFPSPLPAYGQPNAKLSPRTHLTTSPISFATSSAGIRKIGLQPCPPGGQALGTFVGTFLTLLGHFALPASGSESFGGFCSALIIIIIISGGGGWGTASPPGPLICGAESGGQRRRRRRRRIGSGERGWRDPGRAEIVGNIG
jgi:hypothetical protein